MKPDRTRVLLISDDPEAVLQVRRAMSKAPEVALMRAAPSLLSDGLRLLAKNNVGVVLLDLNLADSHGLDTLRSIREAFPQVPVLVLSSRSEDTVPDDALKLGAQDYITKEEFNGPMLTRAVRYAIERKHAESTVRGGAELFRSVYQEAPIGIVLTSRDGKFISVNPAFCRLLGYTPEEITGMTFLDVTHPDDRSNNSYNVENMWQGKLPHYRTEKRYIAKDGGTRWGSLSTSLIRDADGNPLYALGMVEDITEHKHAEDLLKQGEERYKLMFDSAPLAINITRGTEITYANPSYLRMFGFSDLAELKRCAPVELFAPESRPKILDNIQHRAQGFPVPESYEAECLRKDGTRFPVLMHLTRTMFADGPATVAFVMDITEPKQAEDALRESEKHFHSLFENMLDGYARCRMIYEGGRPRDFVYLEVNQAFELLTGLRNVVGRRVSDVIPGIQESNPELFELYGRVSATGRSERFETQIEVLDIWLSISVYSPVRGEFVAVFENITERKRAEMLQDAVYRIGTATLTTVSLNDLYGEIHNVISRVMNAENFYIALYDEQWDLLTFPYFRDQADEVYVDEIHPEKGLTAYVLRTGKSLLCTQAVHDELERQGEVKLLGEPSCIWLGVPLFIQGKTIGAIVVQHYSDPAAYGVREQHMLEFVSAQVAVAIERKRAEEEVRRRADELAGLNATVLEITTSHDLNALLQTIVERAAQLLGTPSGGMYLCDPVRQEVRCVVSFNTMKDYAGTVLKYGEGAAGTVAQTGEPIIIDDYRIWGQRAASFEEQQPFSAVLSVPMNWNNQVLGVLHVLDDKEGRRFTQVELSLLTQFANHAAIAVENTRLYEEAQRELTERTLAETHLRGSESALQGILESVADGILAVNNEGKVLHANKRFVEMWRIPQSTMETHDDAILLQHVLDQLADPQAFLDKVQELYKSTDESFDTLTFKDGRVFERRSRPLMQEAEARGRVWSFHDITERRQAQNLQEAVYRIAAAAETTSSLDDLYRQIHETISSVMPAENFYITTYDAAQDLLQFPYFRDTQDEPYIGGVQPARGLTAYVLRTGKSLLCTQAVHDELERRGEVKLLGSPSAIWLGVPLMVEGKPIGAMVVQHYSDPQAYGEREQQMLEFVSTQVALAIYRKQADEALRESEGRFRALFEDSPISLWEEDFSRVKQRLDSLRQDGISDLESYLESHPEVVNECARLVSVSAVNKATLATYGAQSKEDLLGSLSAVLEGKPMQSFREELVKIAAGETSLQWEGANNTLDGRLMDVEMNWSVVPGHEKDLSRVIVSMLDITERKQAAGLQDAIYRIAQAADQTESLEALYPAIHTIIRETMIADNFYIALYDEQSDMLSFPYFVDAMESSAPAVKPGKGLTEYVLRSGKSLLCDQALFDQLMRDGQVEPVGAASPIWLGVPLVVDGKVLGVIAVQDYQNVRAYGRRDQDVLEFVSSQAAKAIQRKRAEEALLQAEEKYRSIFENATEAITQSTPEGRFVTANPAAAHILGYDSPADLMLEMNDLTHHSHVMPGRREDFVRLMEQDGAVSGFESEVYRRDGATRWISENMHVVRGGDGRILYYEGTAQDITERKHAEQALEQRARELQTLYETSLEVSAQTSLDKLLTAIVQRAASLVGTDGGGLYLMEPDGQSLTLLVGHNLPPAHIGTRLRLGEGISGAVAQSGKAMQVEDYQLWPGRARVYDSTPFRRVLAVPLKVKDKMIGVINVSDMRLPGSFSEDQIRLASLFADQAALAIEAGRLYQEERSRSAELSTLYESATAMSSNLSLDVVLRTVVEQVTKALNTDECAVSFVDSARDAVVTMLDYAPTVAEQLSAPGTTYFLKDYPTTRRVLESRQPLQISRNGPEGDARETDLLEKSGMGTLLLVPLVARGQVSGLMELYWKEKRRVTTSDELHLTQSLSAQIAVYLENSRLFERSERRLSRTLALHRIDQAVTGSTDVSLILQVILDQALPQLGAAAAAILLYDPITQGLNYASGSGFRTEALRHTQLAMGQGYAGRAAMARQIVHIPDLRSRNTDFLRSPSFSQEGFISYTAVPLIAKGEIKGVLEVFHRTPLEPDSEWQSFLETLAGQAATAVDSATMFEDLQRANDQLTLAYDATIEGWSRAMDLRDRETEGHSQRVAEMTVHLARLLGLPDQNLVHVRRGALLHDIGKMGVPDDILQKVGPLTDAEWVVMKRHPIMAYEMLAHIRYLEPALEIPYCHHEKWDGSGYPRGLQGDRIPLAARVFAVVDVYDALTANRPYRPAWTSEQALEYIRSQSGKQFEPAVAEAFLGMMVLQTEGATQGAGGTRGLLRRLL